ncbi:MAG TPA: divergent polysaccharide deacetylase family protein [Dongiaceae bacterium]|jgi:polysaccharide deacetylase 2 family uncharacterized protein YibQ|nr:divergent polysaccharide deacetylase family protein [Dongiaceae bacterium]
MAKRRAKKSSPWLRRQWQQLKKRLRLPRVSLLPQLPHSSVFIAGVAIGLAAGLAGGLALAWLDRPHRAAPRPSQVAAIVPPKVTEPAPKPTAPQPAAPIATPPVYVEQTEPQPDDTDDSGAMGQLLNPPALDQRPVSATPQPAVPDNVSAQPQPAIPAPAIPAPATPSAPAIAPIPAAPQQVPAWLQNSVASIDPGSKPMIAIILDDVGAAPGDAPGAVALPAPITLSIMTYAPNAARLADQAKKAGHEIMVHVPMEAINRDADPGKNALLVNLSPGEIQQRLDWDLSQFQGYVGINNHMGSRFTQDPAGMQIVLETLKAKGLLFVDSRTIASSVGDALAGRLGVTHLKRDVFLDNVIDEADIRKELARTEAIARKQGFVIAIGHPHPDTVAALRQWIPEAKARGFVLVPITAIAKKQAGVTG